MSAQRQYVYFDGQWLSICTLERVVDQNVSFFSKLLIRFISWCEKTFKQNILLYICMLKHNLSRLSSLTSTHRTCKSHDWLMYMWSLVNIVIVDCMHAIGRFWWTYTHIERTRERERNYKWTLKSIPLFFLSLSLSLSLFLCLLHSCRWERERERDIDCICFNAE